MNQRQDGFTLIEVLIASAIIMASLGVLMQLFGSGLERIQHAGQKAHMLASQRYIVHFLEDINPASQSDGKGVAEGLVFYWKASIQEPFHLIYGSEGAGQREVALYDIKVRLQTAQQKQFVFVIKQLGWHQRP